MSQTQSVLRWNRSGLTDILPGAERLQKRLSSTKPIIVSKTASLAIVDTSNHAGLGPEFYDFLTRNRALSEFFAWSGLISKIFACNKRQYFEIHADPEEESVSTLVCYLELSVPVEAAIEKYDLYVDRMVEIISPEKQGLFSLQIKFMN